jgi:thioredoxin reductase (NADPH)
LLLATGSRYKRLNVQGETDFLGAYKGKRVAVIGGGNSATEESLLLTKFTDQVTILVRSGKFNATAVIQEKVLSHPKIDVRWFTEVKEFIGKDSKLTQLRIFNNQTGAEGNLQMEGAFIFIGLVPNTGFLEGSKILLDRWGFIVTGHALLHGDHRPNGFERDTSTKQVVSAAGEGSTAALMVREYLKSV